MKSKMNAVRAVKVTDQRLHLLLIREEYWERDDCESWSTFFFGSVIIDYSVTYIETKCSFSSWSRALKSSDVIGRDYSCSMSHRLTNVWQPFCLKVQQQQQWQFTTYLSQYIEYRKKCKKFTSSGWLWLIVLERFVVVEELVMTGKFSFFGTSEVGSWKIVLL